MNSQFKSLLHNYEHAVYMEEYKQADYFWKALILMRDMERK